MGLTRPDLPPSLPFPHQAPALVEQAVRACVTSGGFTLSAPGFRALRQETGLEEDALLLALVEPCRAAAAPPVSGYRVGAAALGASGRAYLGVNLEFPGTPLNTAVHAEQFAVTLARRAAERTLQALATSAPPCGHCRQWLYELPLAGQLRCLTASTAAPLAHLLPAAFGPQDLLPGGTPLLLGARHNGMQFSAPVRAQVERWRASASPELLSLHEAAYAALAAANAAHAPYSACPSGCAVVSVRPDGGPGGVHAGGTAESAAFNPSISPLQAALVAACADGVSTLWAQSLQQCVLVQPAGAHVSHVDAVAMVLRAVAPGCHLTLLHLEDFRAPRAIEL